MSRARAALAGATVGLVSVLGAASALAGPTTPEAPAAKTSNVETAVVAGQLDTLVSLVKKAGFASTLSGKGPFTVFAPTDAAFSKVPKSTLAALAKDRAWLEAVLMFHVASGKVTASKVVGLDAVKTLQGQSAKVRTSDGKVFSGARVTTPDVMASNGVIHVVDRVLIPSG